MLVLSREIDRNRIRDGDLERGRGLGEENDNGSRKQGQEPGGRMRQKQGCC